MICITYKLLLYNLLVANEKAQVFAHHL